MTTTPSDYVTACYNKYNSGLINLTELIDRLQDVAELSRLQEKRRGMESDIRHLTGVLDRALDR